ncbi:recombinase RecT [Cyanobium sp. Cruz CV13-4-11]|uniref:recombinase RecT n=1 Tax=unclassified Cyanobium TaxID=2627006 RepID=UPI0020CC240B|nr:MULTISPECIES: recombinase RecT [unclassified Cyanobium]MCP9901932.1 recombinase RecT [Cyanobium sp. Cruz CV11-17]MCP9920823.1 recombinase RecT [Cyanobium sp. Cruz CV13-4-11]
MTPTDTAPPGAASAPPQPGGAGALVRTSGSEISAGVFSGIAAFEAAQRMAQCLCSSTMVPTEYRGQQGLANSLIALEIAGRMGLSPLVVMQNMTPIHGRPSWSSSFLIATVNASGRFTPLRFHFDDEENPSWCYAEACDRSSGETLKGEKVSVAMAKREGWWSRKDRHGNETSKWQTMTGQMLRYRAASFWVRVYCPEMSLGLTTQEEALDANAPAAAVQTVTVREVPLAKGNGTGGAVPQPIRPMPLREQAVQAEPKDVDDAAGQEEQPASDVASTAPLETPAAEDQHPSTPPSGEPEAQPATRARRGTARGRRSVTASDEPAASAPAAAPQPSEPVTAGADGSDPVTEGTPELGAMQELFAAAASPASHHSSGAAQVVGPTAEASQVAEAPELLEPTEPSAAEVVQSGLQEIPRIASLQALDGAKARVNALLASGRINEDGAERLWAVIDRRRQELQAVSEAEAEEAP